MITNKQANIIIERLKKDPDKRLIWVNKYTYILKGYLDKANKATEVTSKKDCLMMIKLVALDETSEEELSNPVNLILSGMALVDATTAMAAEMLTEGEMRVGDKDDD